MPEGYRRSSAANLPLWLRFAMPSIADVIFVALLCLLVFTPLAVRLLGDAGIGWHIRTGQLILSTHHIPHTDPFSSTMAGKPWFAWEWLYDVKVGWLDSAMGLNGVVWYNALIIAAVFGLTMHLLVKRGVNAVTAVILLLLAIVASMIHFLARPHVVSWLFTVAWFAILDHCERDSMAGRRATLWRVWVLPVLMVFWVNFHGGFLVGLVLVGIFWVAALWDSFRAKEDRIELTLRRIAARERSWRLFWVGVVSTGASLINPYGWKLHVHIFRYLSDRFLMNHIEEFQSPDFHGVAQRCFLVLLLATVAALACRGRTLRPSSVLVLLFAVYTGLYSSRNIPVSSLLLVLVIGPLLSPASAGGFSSRMSALQSGLRGHLWPIAAFAFTLAIAAGGGRLGSAQLMNAHFDPRRMPVEAVNYFEAHRLSGPILAPDSWGGYLIYRLYPGERVIVDDRHDLYGEEFFKSYLKMIRVEQGWQQFLDSQYFTLVMFPRNTALTNVLLESPQWKPIYQDDTAVIFERAAQIGRPLVP
jgi:hypothetical protein